MPHNSLEKYVLSEYADGVEQNIPNFVKMAWSVGSLPWVLS